MMLRIDRISLRLPAGYAHRATSIARLIGEHIGNEAAALPPRQAEQLTVSVVVTHPQASDSEIAHLAAAQLRRSLRISL